MEQVWLRMSSWGTGPGPPGWAPAVITVEADMAGEEGRGKTGARCHRAAEGARGGHQDWSSRRWPRAWPCRQPGFGSVKPSLDS